MMLNNSHGYESSSGRQCNQNNTNNSDEFANAYLRSASTNSLSASLNNNNNNSSNALPGNNDFRMYQSYQAASASAVNFNKNENESMSSMQQFSNLTLSSNTPSQSLNRQSSMNVISSRSPFQPQLQQQQFEQYNMGGGNVYAGESYILQQQQIKYNNR